MSRTIRHKHVLKEMMHNYYDVPTATQKIVRVVSSRGNNLHEVEPAEVYEENYLVSMPNKFRNNVWVKRGDYVVVEPIEEGVKVRGEIYKILTTEHIKEYTKAGIWPKRFAKKIVCENDTNAKKRIRNLNDSDEEGFIVKNTNRPAEVEPDDADDDEDSDSDSESESEGNVNNSKEPK